MITEPDYEDFDNNGLKPKRQNDTNSQTEIPISEAPPSKTTESTENPKEPEIPEPVRPRPETPKKEDQEPPKTLGKEDEFDPQKPPFEEKKKEDNANECPKGDELNEKVSQWQLQLAKVLIEKYGNYTILQVTKLIAEKLPAKLFLSDSHHGSRIKINLLNGFLQLPKARLLSQATCTDRGATQQYDFLVQFTNPDGAFDWQIKNLFGRNLNESALVTVRKNFVIY